MATTSLQAIQEKVRRITRAPSSDQLTDAQLNEYINTFVLYDFPSHVKLFSLKTTFSFYCEPNVDVYETDTTTPTDPLYQFKQRYMTIMPPIYIAGYNSFYSQSREQFFNIYPMISFIQSIGAVGDGVTTSFSGTLSQVPIMRNDVQFTSIDVSGNGLVLIDVPVNATSGELVIPNDFTLPSPYGAIDYITGAFTVNFPTAPASGAAINSQTVPYQAARPLAMLFFDNKFTLRPIPDQPYKIQMDVFVRPTELLSTTQSPELEQWWQYIAWGAAKKVFEDRMDLESINLMMPEFKKQEALVLRRSLVQRANERTSTIYTEQVTNWAGNNGWGWGGGLF